MGCGEELNLKFSKVCEGWNDKICEKIGYCTFAALQSALCCYQTAKARTLCVCLKLTPCLSLVIFISETSVVFVISFLFLQLQRLPIHSSPANLIVIHSTFYNGISQADLNKIQRIQNTLARVVTNTSKFEHITPILKKLHWLPIKQRIDYKLCLYTYKRFKFSNLPIFTIVFLFLLTLCLQDHLIHRFCPSIMCPRQGAYNFWKYWNSSGNLIFSLEMWG